MTALIGRELAAAELEAAQTAEVTTGAAEFLQACRSTGRVGAVVSNNSASAVVRYLDRVGWSDLVHRVKGRDPADPARMKPHPDLLLRTLTELAVAAESAVIVGDSVTDVEAGLAADVWTVGYANKPGKDEAMREAGADVVLTSMRDLAAVTARTPTCWSRRSGVGAYSEIGDVLNHAGAQWEARSLCLPMHNGR